MDCRFEETVQNPTRLTAAANTTGSHHRGSHARSGIERSERFPTCVRQCLRDEIAGRPRTDFQLAEAAPQNLEKSFRASPLSPGFSGNVGLVLEAFIEKRSRSRPSTSGTRIHELNERSVSAPCDDKMSPTARNTHNHDRR